MLKTKEAFKDKKFLESPERRSIRILAEYEKVKSFFEIHKIIDTITFFDSARIKATEDNKNLTDENTQYYVRAREFALKFTSWAKEYSKNQNRFIIATGGGPEIMEAANRGALEAGWKSIGLGIKLPEEQENNKYITPGLSLQFYYFFMRKFFLVQPAKATIIFLGGFGTLDELTEILTLKQTGKIQKPMPIVLFGKKFWNTTINFNYLFGQKMINKDDLNLFLITGDVEQAFEFVSCILNDKCIDNPQTII